MKPTRTPALALCAALPVLLVPGPAADRQVDEVVGPPTSEAILANRLVITEFMKDPAHVGDTQGEWIEVYNLLPWRLNIEGWSIGDDSGPQHVIDNGGLGVYLRPGEHFVLGRNGDPLLNGGVTVDYVYSGVSLPNGADSIVIRRRNGVVADRVAYDDGVMWPDQAGQSISLDPGMLDPLLNDDPANWCHATTPISGANPDTGTPGAANDGCP